MCYVEETLTECSPFSSYPMHMEIKLVSVPLTQSTTHFRGAVTLHFCCYIFLQEVHTTGSGHS